MGRDKLKRHLQFKPKYRKFTNTEYPSEETIQLLHEEIEALYLMDSKELYQADAAKEMGISRPTFARIIKSARQKVTMMLMTGANLEIIDEKEDIMIIIPSQKENNIIKSIPKAPFLLIYHIKNQKILKKEVIENPVYKNKMRPAQILPLICSQKGINFFMAEEIGTGLKSALLSRGVFSLIESDISEDKICKIPCC